MFVIRERIYVHPVFTVHGSCWLCGCIHSLDCLAGVIHVLVLNEGITMCLEIKYYNISVRQHNLIIYL